MALKTACERIKHAQERIKTKGWVRRLLRKPTKIFTAKTDPLEYNREVAAGAACLVGSLIDDDEFVEYTNAPTYPSIYNNSVPLPGLAAAYAALGFQSGYAAYLWNDKEFRTQAEVEAKLADAQKTACPEEPNE